MNSAVVGACEKTTPAFYQSASASGLDQRRCCWSAYRVLPKVGVEDGRSPNTANRVAIRRVHESRSAGDVCPRAAQPTKTPSGPTLWLLLATHPGIFQPAPPGQASAPPHQPPQGKQRAKIWAELHHDTHQIQKWIGQNWIGKIGHICPSPTQTSVPLVTLDLKRGRRSPHQHHAILGTATRKLRTPWQQRKTRWRTIATSTLARPAARAAHFHSQDHQASSRPCANELRVSGFLARTGSPQCHATPVCCPCTGSLPP